MTSVRSLRSTATAIAVVVAWGAAGCAAPGPTPVAVAGARAEIVISLGEWRDPARNGRVVPYKLYMPAGAGPFPVVIHSHGLGGSREASTYILEGVATAGIAVFAIQHPGSDTSVLPAGNLDGVTAADLRMSPEAAANRFADLPFVVRQLDLMNAEGVLRGRLDMSRLGMSGHSFGALSTLVAVGQSVGGVAMPALREPRIDAAIVYSPNKPRNMEAGPALAGVVTPILHFTGTEDSSSVDLERTPWERTIPFRTITGADQYLVYLTGGDHQVFSGRRQVAGRLKSSDPEHMRLIIGNTVLFWRAYLLDDQAAMAALCELPARVQTAASGYVKARRCGPPTPLPQDDG